MPKLDNVDDALAGDRAAALIEHVVMSLVEHKDKAEIEVVENGDESVELHVHVDEDEIGRVIGKKGRVIQAMRKLARAVGIAKCGRTIGLKGEIVLWPISNVEQRYLVGSIFVDKNGNEFTIDKIRPLKDQYVVKFKGFDNIEQVKKFVNIEFFMI